MKRNFTSLVLLTSGLLLSGCVATQPPKQKTALEIQAIQSRSFETNIDIAFAATLSVFQDLGYIAKSLLYGIILHYRLLTFISI